LVERTNGIRKVTGSIPASSTSLRSLPSFGWHASKFWKNFYFILRYMRGFVWLRKSLPRLLLASPTNFFFAMA
jgi:hypothetical protein